MPIIRIPTPLRKFTEGKDQIDVNGENIKQILASLNSSYPGIGERILDEEGKPRKFVNIYLNDEDIRFLDSLDSKVKDDDSLAIVPAIAGGVN